MRKFLKFINKSFESFLIAVVLAFAVYGAYNFGGLIYKIIEKISCNG